VAQDIEAVLLFSPDIPPPSEFIENTWAYFNTAITFPWYKNRETNRLQEYISTAQ